MGLGGNPKQKEVATMYYTGIDLHKKTSFITTIDACMWKDRQQSQPSECSPLSVGRNYHIEISIVLFQKYPFSAPISSFLGPKSI